MSTAGKVLSVLVALMVLVSIYLLSMVSQLNRSWGSRIETVAQQNEQAAEQIRQTEAEAFATEQQVLAERLATAARARSLRTTIEDRDNRLSALKETQLRFQLSLQDNQALAAEMRETIADREQVQADLSARLAEANELRDRLAAENAAKLDRLQSLRSRLTELLAENDQLLRRVSRGASSDDSPAENTE
ncbi:hypothetical protein [Tautonia sociabilis]|uniref:Uncharacterized protein n=1 Tax=Tautonia sociabilis TaxID=2080755 RepID=A0A432MIW2_9BACT|nr:hypothetical protein [Tautonia sociabilis]RUL87239.1 hypothetical protein TsocGM_13520 [Tautonia sociabilis]